MKNLQSIKKYSMDGSLGGVRDGADYGDVAGRKRKTAGGTVNNQPYSSDIITKHSITFIMLTQ